MERYIDRYLQLDLARSRAFDRAEISDLLLFMSRIGYNGLVLYLEGSFAYESIEGVVRNEVMTPADANWIVREAEKYGICVVPMTNLFGHMEQFVDRESCNYLSDNGKNQVDFTSSTAEDFALTIANELARHFKTDVVHIGADETDLNEQSRPLYAAFLAKVCRRLIDVGISPAIWSDMLWMHPELVSDIPRECIIYDWNYYGHRPDSLQFWKDSGFKKLFVCPADQSWEGFINFYRTCGYLKATMDPIGSGEVEAFLVDGYRLGVPGACLTTWEHRFGNSFWSQLVPMARAGLYMSGKWEPGTEEDTAFENAIFGYETPYSSITNILREYCQQPLYEVEAFYPSVPRTALFVRDSLQKYLASAPVVASKLLDKWKIGVEQSENELKGWKAQGAFEQRCLTSMKLTCAIAKTSYKLLNAAYEAYNAYHSAADYQFSDTVKAIGLLKSAADKLESSLSAFAELKEHLDAVIASSGHPRIDKCLIEDRITDIAVLVDSIRYTAFDLADENKRKISLISWQKLVHGAIAGEPVWGYI